MCVRVFGIVSYWCWVMLYNLMLYRIFLCVQLSLNIYWATLLTVFAYFSILEVFLCAIDVDVVYQLLVEDLLYLSLQQVQSVEPS